MYTFGDGWEGGRRRPRWAPIIAGTYGVEARLLDAAEVDGARRLLYETYYREQGWDPPPNASEVRANHETERFEDAFDGEAIWYGLVDRQKQVVGCGRIIDPARSGGLELERYVDLDPALLRGAIETNRVAVARAHRRGLALPALASLGAFAARQATTARYCIGTVKPRIADGVAKDHGWVRVGPRFRYDASDEDEVVVVRYDLSRGAGAQGWGVARRVLRKASSRVRTPAR